MKALALGVVQDLRNRRLLPVAVLLLAALVAVPVLMLKPAESAVPPAATSAVSPPAGTGGLPTPEQALQGNGKPLVSLAVLGKPSNLASFDSKDPFKPLQNLQAGLPDATGGAPTGAGEGAAGGGTGGGGGTGTGDPGSAPTPGAPGPGGTAPTDPSAPPTEQQKFTYTLDASFEGPNGLRRFRNMTRLRMLPSEEAPLLIFLGVDSAGEKAVFLVDSTVKMLEGEGSCSPDRDACAVLAMEPGERQVFVDEKGERYEIQIDQINERSLASVARAARAARKKVARTSVGHNRARRFAPPVLSEILTGVQR